MTNPKGHALYHFFSGDELLYIGKTTRLPERWNGHSKNQPWWSEVTRCIVEHFPDEIALGRAEIDAITNEHPRYNIMHNKGSNALRKKQTSAEFHAGFPAQPAEFEHHYGDIPDPGSPSRSGWTFRNRESGYTFIVEELWLYPELDGSSVVADHPQDPLGGYIAYLKRNHRDWLNRDAVPIYWSVVGDGIHEAAPEQFSGNGDNEWDYCCGSCEDCSYDHFLTWFTQPRDTETGEVLNWYQLPVRNNRFPKFAKALSWTPSPLQPYCPLVSILKGVSCLHD